jgi:ketosteroid isomerase-like protein
MKSLFVVAAASVLLTACAGTASRSGADGVIALDRAFARMSVEKGTRAAFAQFTAPDVLNLPPNAPITRSQADVLRRFDNLAPNVLTWAAQGGDQSGDLGYTYGEWSIRRGVGGAVLSKGKYLTVWKRQPDGSWKASVDMGNTSR